MVFAGFFLVSSRGGQPEAPQDPPPPAVFVTGDFDVSGATLVYKDMLLVTPRDIEFSTDGTKLFVVLDGSSTVYEYSMSTAWDITTLSQSTTASLAVSNMNEITAIDFNRNGTKLYACGTGNVAEFSMSNTYDLSTAGSQSTLDISVHSGQTIYGACFSNSETSNYLHFTSSSSGNVNTISTLEIASPLSGSTLVGRSANVVPLLANVVASDLHTTRTLEVSGGGTRFYQIYRNTDLSNVYVVEFKLGTPHDASTLTSATQIEDYYDLADQTGGTTLYDTFNSLKIKPDGSEMFLSGTNFLNNRQTLNASSGTAGTGYTSRNLNYALVQYGNNTNYGRLRVFEYSPTDETYVLRETISGNSSNRLNYGPKFISNDGNTIFSIFNGPGTIYLNVLTYNGSTWSFSQKTTLSNGRPGSRAMCLSPNDDLLFFATETYKASGRATGGFEVWAPSGGTWSQTQIVATPNTTTSDTTNFSEIVITADGNTLVACSAGDDTYGTDKGIVYFFSNVNGTWTATGETLEPPSVEIRFGYVGLDVNDAGTRVVVSDDQYNSTNDGRVYIYNKINGTWSLTDTLDNPEGSTGRFFGVSTSFNAFGTKLLVGARSNSTNGRAYLYEYDGSSWNLIETFTSTATTDAFGDFVSLSKSGTFRAVISETQTSSTGRIHFYTGPQNTQTYSLDVPSPVFYLSGDIASTAETSNGESNVSLSYTQSTTVSKVGTGSIDVVNTTSSIATDYQHGMSSTDAYHSFSFWINMPSFSSSDIQRMAETSAYRSSVPSAGGYRFQFSSNRMYIYCKNSSGTIYTYSSPSSSVTSSDLLNKWNHVVLVVPVASASSTNVPYVYFNTERIDFSGSGWQNLYWPDYQSFTFATGTTAYIDDYKMFNTLLSEKTVQKIYLDGLAPPVPQTFHLTFEDNTGADTIVAGATLGGTSLSTLQSNTVTFKGSFVGDYTGSSSTTLDKFASFIGSDAKTFSISFWMYYTGTIDNSYKTVVGLFDGESGQTAWAASPVRGFRIRIYGNNVHYFYNSTSSVSTSVSNLANNWNHVTITTYRSSSAHTHTLYINGAFINDATSSLATYRDEHNLYIGVANSASLEPFTGYLDDFRIYNRELAFQEVEYLYTSTIVHKDQTFYLSYDQSNVYDYHNEASSVSATGTGQYNQDPGSRVGTHSGQYPQGTTGTLVPTWSGLSSSTSLTFSMWVFPKTISGTHYLFSTETVDSGTQGIAARLESSSGNLRVTIVTFDSTFRTKYRTLSSISNYTNKWMHLAFVFTSTTGEIYINGSEQTLTSSGTWSYNITSGDGLRIGDIDDGTGASAFNGALDDFRVFSRGLNTEEISALYRAYANSRIYDVDVGILPIATYFGASGTYVPPTDGTITVNTDTTTQANFTFSGSTSGNDGTYDVSSTTLSSASLDLSFDNNNTTQLSFTGGGTLEIIFSIENETFRANQLRLETKANTSIDRTPQNVVIYGGTTTQLYSGSTGFSYAGSTIQSGEEVSTIDFANSTGYSSYKLAFSNPISGSEIKIADIKFRIV